ncbi:MAG: hypothetical protein WCN92_09860 [Eubacteriales bacterium]
MKISTKAIASNSDMIKNYKCCREKSENEGKLYILKNNQPDAVLFSIAEYERISDILEYLESREDEEVARLVVALPKKGSREVYSLKELNSDRQ